MSHRAQTTFKGEAERQGSELEDQEQAKALSGNDTNYDWGLEKTVHLGKYKEESERRI